MLKPAEKAALQRMKHTAQQWLNQYQRFNSPYLFEKYTKAKQKLTNTQNRLRTKYTGLQLDFSTI
jgi:hypothetical protein